MVALLEPTSSGSLVGQHSHCGMSYCAEFVGAPLILVLQFAYVELKEYEQAIENSSLGKA